MKTNKLNVLIISVDSLRADHLGCYGYGRDTSPFLDAFAEQGLLAERLLCPGLPTYPSYTTLYTGQHPLTHGILAHGGHAKLDRDVPFLPQLLIEEDYTTCAIDNLVRGRPWFGRGYEFYIDPSWKHTVLTVGVTCDDLNARAIPWLRHHAGESFFLFIHYWDPHWPYKAPPPYRGMFYDGNATDPDNRSLDEYFKHPLGSIAKETWLRTAGGVITDAECVCAMYDQEIRRLDDGIRNVIDTLDGLGLADNTLVIVTGDHGESLTEHGIYFDHHGLYDATLHVPLLVRLPGRIPAGRCIREMLQVQDIAPTILDAVGLPVPKTMEGRSFLPQACGDADAGGYSRVISAESTWQAAWSLRTDTMKLILNRHAARAGHPPKELYDLVQDPYETKNLVNERPDVAAAMEEELEAWISERLKTLGKEEDPLIAVGPSMRDTLSELC